MPKINVYLPDDLAAAVKASGVPVSAVCQRALEDAVRKSGGPMGDMSRFTDRARKALALAKQHAAEQGAGLGSEFLLMGLIDEGAGIAARAMSALGVTSASVAEVVQGRPPMEDGDAVLALTLRESLTMGHNYIGTEHLLLGATRTLSDVLAALNVPASSVRREVTALLTAAGVPAPAPPKELSPDVSAKLDEVLRRLEQLEKRLPQ